MPHQSVAPRYPPLPEYRCDTLSFEVCLLTRTRIASAVLTISAILLAVPELAAQQNSLWELPDAPSAVAAQSTTSSANTNPSTSTAPPKKLASVHRIRINQNEIAPQLTTKETVALALENSVSPWSIFGWFAAAGWSHLIDSAPNYGTDSAGFGERLGAAAIRGVSGHILGNAIMAPILHEDIRYYRLGRSSGQGYVKRGVHAATRVFITRKTNGDSSINYHLLTGNLENAALTPTYYPERNRTAGTVATAYAGSLGGAALSFLLNEFLPDALSISRLRKSE